MIGTTIGKYRIVSRLGRGGMGTVYRAIDETLDREVAIKVLNSELADAKLMARFRAEATTLARLNHPEIATIYEIHRTDTDLLMVMELVRGETLEQLSVRLGPLVPDQAALIVAQILSGLGYAHRAGIVHRDLKPANVMMSETGIVKVMDFGIARVLGAEHLTSDGTLMGTPAYMAPEQIMGSEIDARADLYSVGVLFYRLLTGCLPFQAETPIGIVHKQLWETAPSARSQRQDLPEWCEAILTRALAKAPADRFQSAEEFRAALFTALGYTPGGLNTEALLTAPVQPPPAVVTPAGGLTPAEIAAAPTMTMVEHESGSLQAPASTPQRNTPPVPPVPPDSPVLGATPAAHRTVLLAGSALVVVVALAAGGFALASRRGTPGQRTDVAAETQANSAVTPAAPAVAPAAAPVSDTSPRSIDTPAPAAPDARASNTPGNPTVPGKSSASPASRAGSSASSPGTSAPASTIPPAVDAATSAPEPSAVPAAASATAAALALPPVTFRAQTVVVEDGKNRQRDTSVEMANGVITVTDRDKKLVTSIPYGAIVGLTYSNSKQPLWNTPQGPAEIAHLDGGAFGFLRGDQHWVSIRTDAMSLVWRVREQDSRRVILAIEERTGKKVDLVKER